MKLVVAGIDGLFRIPFDPKRDDRGFFARSFCKLSLADAGMDFEVVQANLSYNKAKGTLRGMHYQADPVPDPKIVRCVHGSIFDVVLDLRVGSPTYLKWEGFTLSGENRESIVIPPGCAHGFMTLTDDAEVFYLMGAPYEADLARGVRWNDPAFGIKWPMEPVSISERDASYPDYGPGK